MAKVIVGTTMSLDGFMNDRNGDVQRLYPDLEALGQTEMLQESIRNTGAVIMGRHAFEMGDPDWYVGNYEYQVPIFVVTHHAPEKPPRQDDKLTFTFVTDGVESAVRQAKAAAGDKVVTVIGGASVAQQILQAGLADELEIGIMPILLGAGLRFFEHLQAANIKLELIEVLETNEARTDLRYRIVK
jgi:dihydrofolate reductase